MAKLIAKVILGAGELFLFCVGVFVCIQILKAYYSDCGHIELNGRVYKQQADHCTNVNRIKTPWSEA